MHTTPLYRLHKESEARLVDFAGWEMPLKYGSEGAQLREHEAARQRAALFDVSHMCPVEIRGAGAGDFLCRLLAGDVGRLDLNQALYCCMLNSEGGVIDDLIVYRLQNRYLIVFNAGRAEVDCAWTREQAAAFGGDVEIEPLQGRGLIAIQGPRAAEILAGRLELGIEELPRRFRCLDHDGLVIARTGYTGEDGFEIIAEANPTRKLWLWLHVDGAELAGLGARDSLRLEAGLPLYGHEMDEQVTPLEAGLEWTLHDSPEERDYIGRSALQAQREAGVKRVLVGMVLLERGMLRENQEVWIGDNQVGVTTSGGFSPTLKNCIALARLDREHAALGTVCEVGRRRSRVKLVSHPFVRKGQPTFELD